MKKIKVCHMSSAHEGLDTRIFYKECISISNYFDVSLVINASKKEIEIAREYNITLIDLGKSSSRFHRMIVRSFRCFWLALKTNSKIYHFHDPELIPYAIILRLFGKKVIYDVHEDLPEDIVKKEWIPSSLRKLVSLLIGAIETLSAKLFFEVITATPYILERFIKINKESININNYPLAKEIPRDIKDNYDFTKICYIGGINESRGLIELMEACALLDSRVELSIAGNFLNEQYKKRVMEHEYWDKVHYFGFVNRKEIQKILYKASIGIVALHPTKAYRESLPVKMFEYMSHGMPIIASNFPRWKKIVDDNKCGLLVNPNSPQDIASAIVKLASNYKDSVNMGLNGRNAVVNEYNWSIEEKKLIQLYERYK